MSDDDFTVTGDELDRCLDRAERAEAENERLHKAISDAADALMQARASLIAAQWRMRSPT